MASVDDVTREKQRLRRRVLAARDALPAAERRRRSAAVCARALALPELAEAGTVLAFAAFGSEVDTRPLCDALLARGRRLCLPRVEGPREMVAVAVTDLDADLRPGTWDIPEPLAGLPVVDPVAVDAVIVPGAVFDARGSRAGYGGGFYDTFVPRLRPEVPRIALAFELQLVDDVPRLPHDLPVTVIVTERRVLRPGEAAGRAAPDGRGQGTRPQAD